MNPPDSVKVNDRLSIPSSELQWKFGPSGGPGGQHANTANTRAELVFDIEASAVLTDEQRSRLVSSFGPRLRVVADDARSQTRNRQLAIDRLAERLRGALQPQRRRRPTKPSRGSRERRLEAKRQQSQRKAQRRKGYDG